MSSIAVTGRAGSCTRSIRPAGTTDSSSGRCDGRREQIRQPSSASSTLRSGSVARDGCARPGPAFVAGASNTHVTERAPTELRLPAPQGPALPVMPSRTALLTAAARGLHREEPPPWVLDDWLAMRLGGDEASRMGEMLRERLPPAELLAFSRWVCVRGRLTEDIVERAAVAGVGQYVIVDAGLDSFAYRRADVLERVRLFEVDHPVS